MNATVLDLRTNMKDILKALNRNEEVTLTYRGKKKAVIVPCEKETPDISASAHSAFGIWNHRDDMKDVKSYVRDLRKGRF